MIRIQEFKVPVNDLYDKKEEQYLVDLLFKKYRIKPNMIKSFSIFKKAIDARKKDAIIYVYALDLELTDEAFILDRKYPNIVVPTEIMFNPMITGARKLKHRPVVVGFGPSGIFAGLLLSRLGYKPIILERGLDVDTRTKHVYDFWETGKYDQSSTILFGEGGAGTFSDGKLTTLINDYRCKYVLDTLHRHGALKEITYMSKPHIGTDVLKGIIKSIRKEIITLGGQVLFDHMVTDFEITDGAISSVTINNKDKIACDVCFMGLGHSARETFETLYKKGFEIKQKAFSLGVRIEHPQALINQAQYGKFSQYLRPAEYKLSYQSKTGRGAYTFCMCPGGYVMAATSEDFGVVTNGMSESKRDGINANSALLVNIMPEDFNSTHPLAGMYYQREIEQKAFKSTEKPYYAPIQLVGDFLSDRVSNQIGSVIPTYKPGYSFVKMTDLLPKFVTDTMKEALLDFDRKLKGFAMSDAILTGVETRSSSPIRILRDDFGMSNIKGVYPMGEGAGYAGGIMSSAVDGLKQVERFIEIYNNKNA